MELLQLFTHQPKQRKANFHSVCAKKIRGYTMSYTLWARKSQHIALWWRQNLTLPRKLDMFLSLLKPQILSVSCGSRHQTMACKHAKLEKFFTNNTHEVLLVQNLRQAASHLKEEKILLSEKTSSSPSPNRCASKKVQITARSTIKIQIAFIYSYMHIVGSEKLMKENYCSESRDGEMCSSKMAESMVFEFLPLHCFALEMIKSTSRRRFPLVSKS